MAVLPGDDVQRLLLGVSVIQDDFLKRQSFYQILFQVKLSTSHGLFHFNYPRTPLKNMSSNILFNMNRNKHPLTN